MRKYWTITLLSGSLLISGISASAQVDSLLQQADRLLSYKAYGRAIEAYSQLLAGPEGRLTPARKAAVQGQLAYAYKQVGDGLKAERFYRESIDNGAEDDLQVVLNFAQTLAGNGKLQEAQQVYERYLRQKDNAVVQRPPVRSAVPLLSEGNRKEAVRYRLDYLTLNTTGEEFSPAFYRDGLVYVSGSKGRQTPLLAGRSNSADYLDLFYVPNRNSLTVRSIGADGLISQANTKANARRTTQKQKNVPNTRTTAVNSRTASVADRGINITSGLGYQAGTRNVPRQFSPSINSNYQEGPATFSQDGAWIIFTRNDYNETRLRRNTDPPKLKLYTARQQNGAWIDVAGLPFNSDTYSVGHPTLSHDEQLLFFASDMPGGFGGIDLYVSRYQDGRWGRPVNLGEDLNTAGDELFPFVDDTGNLYFSTGGRKGLGGLDIYFATLTTLSTGLVVQSVEHLDAPINSPKDDFGLITDGSRRGGYFSSNRRKENDNIYRFVRESSLYGCRDLTIRLYDTGTNEPLDSVRVQVKTKGEGRPDQTMVTDTNGLVRLCLDGNNEFTFQASRDGYVSSTVGFTTRSLTDDQPSQLEISMTKPTAVVDTIQAGPIQAGPIQAGPDTTSLVRETLLQSRIRGVVTGERSRQPLAGVTVRLRNECDQTKLDYVTEADGRYAFDLVEGCDYTLIAYKPTFGTNTNRIRKLPKKARPKEISADLRMLTVGDVVTIDNVYYDLDRFSLRPDASRELEKLVATMRKYPSLSIEIRSHTDSRGSAEQNRLLSAQRAKAVADYLATKGISRRRTATFGMGESQLVNNCTDDVICTEAEHQRNRRTEFRVVDVK